MSVGRVTPGGRVARASVEFANQSEQYAEVADLLKSADARKWKL